VPPRNAERPGCTDASAVRPALVRAPASRTVCSRCCCGGSGRFVPRATAEQVHRDVGGEREAVLAVGREIHTARERAAETARAAGFPARVAAFALTAVPLAVGAVRCVIDPDAAARFVAELRHVRSDRAPRAEARRYVGERFDWTRAADTLEHVLRTARNG
jgi:hypothetical protein